MLKRFWIGANEDRVLAGLLAACVAMLLLAMFFVVGMVSFRGKTFSEAIQLTPQAQLSYLVRDTGEDSWSPMLRAYNFKKENPKEDVYKIFFEEKIKFQYPPSSLLFFDLFPPKILHFSNWEAGGSLRILLSWLSRLAIFLTILLSALIVEKSTILFSYQEGRGIIRKVARVALTLVLGVTFYPILLSYELGQAQVFLNLFIASAILFYLCGWEALSGSAIGLACLVKPQYGVILLWALFRHKRNFSLGFLAVFLIGTFFSLMRFGLPDYLRYLEVLQMISRQGESLWLNQSVNGLLNRFFENGSPFAETSPSDFAPYHPVVHAATLGSSALILFLSLCQFKKKVETKESLADLCLILVAATLASPVAWTHHYGIFLPLFAALLPVVVYSKKNIYWVLLGISYLLIAYIVWPHHFIMKGHWWGILASYVFAGGVLLFILLIALRNGKAIR